MRGSKRSPNHTPANEATMPQTTTMIPNSSLASFRLYPRATERKVGIHT